MNINLTTGAGVCLNGTHTHTHTHTHTKLI